MKEFIVDDKTGKKYSRRSFVSFGVFFLAGGAAYAGWKWLVHQPLDGGIRGGIQQPLRDVLTEDEKIFSGVFDPNKLVKEYPRSEALRQVRVNGSEGLDESLFDAAAWQMDVVRTNGQHLSIGLDEIKQLPKTEIVFNFKCIEGWSQVTWWGGVRFADFAKHYGLTPETRSKYVGLVTPDEEYYVGVDMPSMMHPQTLLCYEVNGKPLPMNQGYPLRLIIPVKYGVKHLKRIGTMSFADEKPADYWAERGYDYYTGH